MSDAANQDIEAYLSRGERVLWRGAPATGIQFRSSDWLVIPFSLTWGAFAFFWEFSVLTKIPDSHPGKWGFVLWGVPFVLVGLYITVGRFFDDAWLRRNTEYAVTNERVLILRGRLRRSLTSLPLKTLPPVTLSEEEGRNGVGSIRFGQAARLRAPPPPAFVLVANAKEVLSIIEDARRKTT